MFSHLPLYGRPPQTLFTMRRPQFALPHSAPSSRFTGCELVKGRCAPSEMNVHRFNVFIMVYAYSICPGFSQWRSIAFPFDLLMGLMLIGTCTI